MENLNAYFKSDFSFTERAGVNYSEPFSFLYYTSSPSRGLTASFDGVEYRNCRRNDDGSLSVFFDDHGLGIGQMMVRRSYMLRNEEYGTGVENVELPPEKLVIEYAGYDGVPVRAYLNLTARQTDLSPVMMTVPEWYVAGLNIGEAAAAAATARGMAEEAREWAEEARDNAEEAVTAARAARADATEAKASAEGAERQFNVIRDLVGSPDPEGANAVAIAALREDLGSLISTCEESGWNDGDNSIVIGEGRFLAVLEEER